MGTVRAARPLPAPCPPFPLSEPRQGLPWQDCFRKGLPVSTLKALFASKKESDTESQEMVPGVGWTARACYDGDQPCGTREKADKSHPGGGATLGNPARAVVGTHVAGFPWRVARVQRVQLWRGHAGTGPPTPVASPPCCALWGPRGTWCVLPCSVAEPQGPGRTLRSGAPTGCGAPAGCGALALCTAVAHCAAGVWLGLGPHP